MKKGDPRNGNRNNQFNNCTFSGQIQYNTEEGPNYGKIPDYSDINNSKMLGGSMSVRTGKKNPSSKVIQKNNLSSVTGKNAGVNQYTVTTEPTFINQQRSQSVLKAHTEFNHNFNLA
jgi:hypothetical protein